MRRSSVRLPRAGGGRRSTVRKASTVRAHGIPRHTDHGSRPADSRGLELVVQTVVLRGEDRAHAPQPAGAVALGRVDLEHLGEMWEIHARYVGEVRSGQRTHARDGRYKNTACKRTFSRSSTSQRRTSRSGAVIAVGTCSTRDDVLTGKGSRGPEQREGRQRSGSAMLHQG